MLKISAHSVKSRIDNMVKMGIIEHFTILPSPLMTNEDSVISILDFEKEQEEKHLLKYLINCPLISRVARLLDGRFIVIGMYFDSDELTRLTSFLRKLPGIKEVEMHFRFLNYWGGKIDLANSHRRVLRCLVKNPRMSISEIARTTGLLSNGVREIIDEMRESETILLTIEVTDVMNERNIVVFAKVQWNVGKTSKENVLSWLQEEFSSTYLGEYVSAIEPTLFFKFSVSHVEEVDYFIQKIKQSGFITNVEPLILFSETIFPDPRLRKIVQLLEETGFTP